MRNNKKNGFSLSEALIAMGILGTIAAILLPSLQSLQPSQDKLLIKKGYQVVERTVNTLVNDDTLYPTDYIFGGDYGTVGGKTVIGGETVIIPCTSVSRFRTNFKNALNLIKVGEDSENYVGRTPDGIDWYVTGTGDICYYEGDSYHAFVIFDVNSIDKGPNCSESLSVAHISLSDYTDCSSDEPDTFIVGVGWDGKLHFGGKAGITESSTDVLKKVNNIFKDNN